MIIKRFEPYVCYFTGGKEPDTASYQIRMLLTNAIPGLLDCKIGKMDDKTLFYYEVTSRQSLQSVFEQRSIGAEALRKLFEQLLDLLEELGQYLLAPDGLVLQPELVLQMQIWRTFLLLSAGKAGTHRLFSEADPGADGISAAEAGSPGAGCGSTRVWTVSGDFGGDLFG